METKSLGICCNIAALSKQLAKTILVLTQGVMVSKNKKINRPMSCAQFKKTSTAEVQSMRSDLVRGSFEPNLHIVDIDFRYFQILQGLYFPLRILVTLSNTQ